MALTDVTTAAKAMNLSGQNDWLASLVPAACAVVENYCKRKLETAAYTEYLDGTGRQELILRQRPVRSETLTGTLNGTTAVTGLSSTALLAAGLRVSGSGIPDGTLIAAVTSATAITLSAAATASGSSSLTFSASLWMDAAGFYGRGSGAFGSTTLLVEGQDYVFRYAPDGTAKSGIALRLAGGAHGAASGTVWPWEWGRGSLTAKAPPVWPAGLGSLKAVYLAGHGFGPEESGGTLPADLTMAANQVVAWLKRNLPLGGPLASENLGSYGYSLAQKALTSAPELGEVRQILSRYRELAI